MKTDGLGNLHAGDGRFTDKPHTAPGLRATLARTTNSDPSTVHAQSAHSSTNVLDHTYTPPASAVEYVESPLVDEAGDLSTAALRYRHTRVAIDEGIVVGFDRGTEFFAADPFHSPGPGLGGRDSFDYEMVLTVDGTTRHGVPYTRGASGERCYLAYSNQPWGADLAELRSLDSGATGEAVTVDLLNRAPVEEAYDAELTGDLPADAPQRLREAKPSNHVALTLDAPGRVSILLDTSGRPVAFRVIGSVAAYY